MPDVSLTSRLSIGVQEYDRFSEPTGQSVVNLCKVYDGHNKTIADLTIDQALALAEELKAAVERLRADEARIDQNDQGRVEKIWRVKVSADVTDLLRSYLIVRACNENEAMNLAEYHINENPSEFVNDAITWDHVFCGDLMNVTADEALEIPADDDAIAKVINPAIQAETVPA